MPITPDEKLIRTLHAEYCRLVGDLPLTLDRIYWWGQWTRNDWGADELRLVVSYLQAEIRKGKRFPGALRWSHLIQQADAFAEELILAKGAQRNAPKPATPKQRVLEQARPTAGERLETTITSKPISDYVKGALAELRRVTQ